MRRAENLQMTCRSRGRRCFGNRDLLFAGEVLAGQALLRSCEDLARRPLRRRLAAPDARAGAEVDE